MTRDAFSGTFEHRVDDRGRVQLPAHWRGASEAFRLHLVETPAPHLLAAHDAQGIEPDPAGRITIPPALRQAAGIEQETVLAGMLVSFTLWSPSVYSAQTKRPVKEESLRLI